MIPALAWLNEVLVCIINSLAYTDQCIFDAGLSLCIRGRKML